METGHIKQVESEDLNLGLFGQCLWYHIHYGIVSFLIKALNKLL